MAGEKCNKKNVNQREEGKIKTWGLFSFLPSLICFQHQETHHPPEKSPRYKSLFPQSWDNDSSIQYSLPLSSSHVQTTFDKKQMLFDNFWKHAFCKVRAKGVFLRKDSSRKHSKVERVLDMWSRAQPSGESTQSSGLGPQESQLVDLHFCWHVHRMIINSL